MLIKATSALLGLMIASQGNAAEFPAKLAVNGVYLSTSTTRIYIDLDAGLLMSEYQSNIWYPSRPEKPYDDKVTTESKLTKPELKRFRTLLSAAFKKGVDGPPTCSMPPHATTLEASYQGKKFSDFVFCPPATTQQLMSEMGSIAFKARSTQ